MIIGVEASGDSERDVRVQYGKISQWDVSRVSNTSGLFQNADHFNADLSSWDVSKACADPNDVPDLWQTTVSQRQSGDLRLQGFLSRKRFPRISQLRARSMPRVLHMCVCTVRVLVFCNQSRLVC